MEAVTLKDVRFAYENSKPMRFDFRVSEGERLTIMGASGSGKSTLLHLLAGFETPISGAVIMGGIDVTLLEPSKRPVSILFQDNNLFGHLTVAQNAGLGIAPRLRLTPDQTIDVEEALAKVGLEGKAKRLPSELSGGEKQRAALARALLRDKPILLLDEPFAALGPAMRVEMLELVLALQKERRLTIIMVTHNPDDAVYFATAIGFMENGKLDEILPVTTLSNPEPNSPLEAYLGSKRHNY